MLNPSFEDNTTIPCGPVTSTAAMSAAAHNWSYPTGGSADIHTTTSGTTCFSYALGPSGPGEQAPRTGDEMGGFYVNANGDSRDYREYLQVRLSSAMVVGETYELEFWISRAENHPFAVNNLGLLMVVDSIWKGTTWQGPLNRTAQLIEPTIVTQDTGWQLVYDCMVADSAYRYAIIGNFVDSGSNSKMRMAATGSYYAYYFVDDVRIEQTSVGTGTNSSLDTTFCAGTSIDLVSSSTGGVHLWNTGDVGATLTVSSPGTYWVTSTSCVSSQTDTFYVTEIPIPATLDLGSDTVFCAGQEIRLQVPNQAGVSYTWSDGSTGNTLITTSPGVYSVVGANTCGSASDDIILTMENCECIAYVPNAFSPNQDGLNDHFVPVMLGCENEIQIFQVYNRYGDLVYDYKAGNQKGWDGKQKGVKSDVGVYTWVLEYLSNDGQTVNRDKGTVTIVR